MADWRSDLVRRFPALFFDERGQPTGGWPAVENGWRDLLTRCCDRIDRALKKAPGGVVRIGQIKEKFGTIRVYLDDVHRLPPAVSAAVNEAVDLAEARSTMTCEYCGDPGVLRKGGWAKTTCDRHAPAGSTPVRPGPNGYVVIQHRRENGKWVNTACLYDPVSDSFSAVPVPPEDDWP